ncbi:Alg9-like mannosyltransferase family-domain-containing protein [Lipomyces kononenkoae]|uniref:Alg9-like mannosyltransferase family-domain-containing protein n=1 Tax=Lipomyces kononenkoae TaxID=34357 RepID=A0ACC3T8W9_LIPKO
MRLNVPLLPLLFQYRLQVALSTKTYFQPDEFWQALEPAHRLVYGYGYLTWEWKDGLRSIAHPMVFSAVYWVSELLGLGDAGLIYGPKVLQALFAAIADYSLYKFASKCYGDEISRLTLMCSVTSAFNFFVSIRTFSNSLEMTLLICALNYWPLDKTAGQVNMLNYSIALVLGAVACVLRPTNALIWFYLGAALVIRVRSFKIVAVAGAVGTIILTLNALVDMWYYKHLTFPLYNFLKFNIVESLSSFYGVNRQLYYIVEALPQLLTVYLPFFFHGIYMSRSSTLAQASVFVVFVYSLISHKEVRFIFPLLPIFHLFAAISLHRLRILARPKLKWTFLVLLSLMNCPLALYASTTHQRGVMDVTSYIRTTPSIDSVGFLMPCHSTPWMSHMHRPDINAWFLTCEPPRGLSRSELATYRDEADQFYDDPALFLRTHFPPLRANDTQLTKFRYDWPSHLVVFGVLEEFLVSYAGDEYAECQRFFNSHFHEDPRRRGDVVVFCKHSN